MKHSIASDVDSMETRDKARVKISGFRCGQRGLMGADGVFVTSGGCVSSRETGLAQSMELRQAAVDAVNRQVPVGAGGSRLLRGNHVEHEALEESAAAYFGAESALYFGSGFAANMTLFATAPQRGDLVVYDEWIHASVHEGLARTRAEKAAARHNDVQAVDDAIMAWRAGGGVGRVWVAVESLYSMDGDGADLVALDSLASRREAVLVIDEAHATGVLGRGRAFIFSTAASPLVAAVTRAAILLCERSDARRGELRRRVECATRALWRYCGLTGSGSHVVPIVMGEDEAAVELAARLRALGFDVRAIRPPTVPVGTARLRVALTLNVTESAVESLFEALGMEMAASGCRR
jgi:8-amino-7-oxononanoate synthase